MSGRAPRHAGLASPATEEVLHLRHDMRERPDDPAIDPLEPAGLPTRHAHMAPSPSRRRRRWASIAPIAAVIAVAALVTACRPAPGDVGVGPGEAAGFGSPSAEAALAEWRDFPVDKVPRPIIVPGSMISGGGFTTGDAKLAFTTGRIELATTLPKPPTTIAVELPEGRFSFDVLPPAEAFDLLKAASGRPEYAPYANPPPLRITSVTLGTSSFSTDRGHQSLPAWLFSGSEFLEPVAWPALGREAFWRYGEPNSAGTIDPSFVSADGRRLEYSVPGPNSCGSVFRYTVEVAEARTAVVLTTHSEIVSTPGPADADRGCILLPPPDVPYPVDLGEPLGNRVVVVAFEDATVAPVGVQASPTP